MNKLDFLSGAPRTLIFEKKSNKTNLGGVWTLIYLIIVLLLIVVYMYDYKVNPKYSVLYTYEHQYKNDKKSIDNRYNNKDFNPKITFNLKMADSKPSFNTDHFLIYYLNNSNESLNKIEFGKDYTVNLYDIYLMIFYKCKKTSEGYCELYDEEKEKNKASKVYWLIFNYTGHKVDHQNAESPLKKEYIQDRFPLTIFDKMITSILRWKTIQYQEEKGIMGIFDNLLGKDNKYYGGAFMDPITFYTDPPEDLKEAEKAGLKILSFISVNTNDPNNYYDLYSRTKKGIFDPISSICSLALTLYNGFAFVFCNYYSNNFDNYKIVEKILAKNKKKPVKLKAINDINDKIEISDDIENIDALLDSNSLNNEENNIDNEKDKDQNTKNHINEKEEIKIPPKLRFYDFFFNNIYFKKCCTSIKQDLLSSCNEIVSKYNSVDYILYNLIKLENLLKDYKWNNPELNDIQNNEFMNNLKLIYGNFK